MDDGPGPWVVIPFPMAGSLVGGVPLYACYDQLQIVIRTGVVELKGSFFKAHREKWHHHGLFGFDGVAVLHKVDTDADEDYPEMRAFIVAFDVPCWIHGLQFQC